MRIVDVRWVERMRAIHIVLNRWPGVWPGWRMYLDGVEIPMEGPRGKPVIRPDAPLDKPPTGLFVGTHPWYTGLDNVEFPCCGTIQFFIPGVGWTNAFAYNLRDLGCRTASAKGCPSEVEHWASYPRGDQPWAIAITPDGAKVYVPCWMSDNVFVLDTTSNRVIKVIDLSGAGPDGAGPRAAGVTPDGKKVYILNARSASIAVIDTASDQVARTIPLGTREAEISAARARAAPTTGDPHRPAKVLFTPDGRRAYAVLYTSLLVLDVEQDMVLTRKYFAPGFFPFDLALSRDGRKLYIGGTQPEQTSPRFYVLDTAFNFFVDEFEVEVPVQGRAGMALSLDGQTLYLSSGDPFILYDPTAAHNKIYFVDLRRKAVVNAVGVSGGPLRMQLSPDGRKAYVVTMASPELHVVDLVNGRWETTIRVGGLRGGLTDKVELVLTPDGRYAYIAALDQDGVMVVDLVEQRMLKFIPFNYFLVQPYLITMTPDEKRLYISCYAHERRDGSILTVDIASGKVVAELIVPDSVSGSDVTPDGRLLYVGLAGGKVLVLDTSTNKVVQEIAIGEKVNDVAITPDGRKAYVLGKQYVHVMELPTHRKIATIAAGGEPQIATLSPDGTILFVALQRGGILFISTSTDKPVGRVEPPVPIVVEAKVPLAVSSDGRHLYWGYFYDFLHIVDVATRRVVWTVHIGARWEADCAPTAAASSPDGTRLYVTMHDGNYLVVMDTRTWRVINTIKVGMAPTDLVITRDGRWAYVVSFQSEEISVVDLSTQSVVRSISVRP
ncbi:MAG: beta-propeller fold lactonase family protein [Candidatus Bipolaricaulaceae bacterium]